MPDAAASSGTGVAETEEDGHADDSDDALTDDEFLLRFGCTREVFKEMRPWKQRQLRRAASASERTLPLAMRSFNDSPFQTKAAYEAWSAMPAGPAKDAAYAKAGGLRPGAYEAAQRAAECGPRVGGWGLGGVVEEPVRWEWMVNYGPGT